jgi:DNA-binding NarL/FixJ family response regulator
MTSTQVVMFISRDPSHRALYIELLRQRHVLSVWVDSASDAPKLLSQFRVAAIVIHMTAVDEMSRPADLVATVRPAPVIVLASVGWNSSANIEHAFNTGCAGVVVEPCTAATLAAILDRSIAGERRIRCPDSPSMEGR